ncbi:uncharacterized protein FIBRA_04325 [Fibroporia radiculosa]|uniref:Cytochrome P450 n=1 Tax=Fibroporia radiculosa TaxID=599839 RepID=J4H2W7_9APHY|nr:uncharacterized protein FIBRA_04325 [Fibroporia radiculosa]CCM02244.1 predicted protein [Fibroporia radiculosa]
MKTEDVLPISSALALAAVARSTLRMNIIVTGLTFGVVHVLVSSIVRSRKARSLAPGPTLWPVLGNVLQLPMENPWETYSKWADIYGDIIHVEVLGQPIILLSSAEVAKDLLDKRSSIYSNRPHMASYGVRSVSIPARPHELLIRTSVASVGFSQGFVLQPYGEEWRRQRKIANQDYNQATVPRYYNLQEAQARKLVESVMNDSSSLVDEIKMRIASIIIDANFGYEVKSKNDPFYTLPLLAMEKFGQASVPGAFLVDFIPQLRYLPEWMPGTGFLKTAKEWRKIMTDASWTPYLWAKENVPKGAAHTPNMCATALSRAGGQLSKEEEFSLVWAGSAMLGGGLDTNMSTVLSFIVAMLRYPEIQAKAQAELDSVIGTTRLPSITDRQSLPYIRSLITEVHRWAPVIPLCLPHALTEDDVYNGIHLPKGSLVMPNVWHMLHDARVYEHPEKFIPERYNSSDVEMQKVTDLVFGFGRRACPGMYFAQGSIFAIVTTMLATCEIVPIKDSQGKPVIPEVAYTSGTICFPKDVKASFKPRSPQAKVLLAQSSSAH